MFANTNRTTLKIVAIEFLLGGLTIALVLFQHKWRALYSILGIGTVVNIGIGLLVISCLVNFGLLIRLGFRLTAAFAEKDRTKVLRVALTLGVVVAAFPLGFYVAYRGAFAAMSYDCVKNGYDSNQCPFNW